MPRQQFPCPGLLIGLHHSCSPPACRDCRRSALLDVAQDTTCPPKSQHHLPLFALQTELQDEVRDMAKRLGAASMQLLVIDTENKFVSTGFAEEIAKAAQGKYYYLPNASESSIAAAASSALAAAKSG